MNKYESLAKLCDLLCDSGDGLIGALMMCPVDDIHGNAMLMRIIKDLGIVSRRFLDILRDSSPEGR